MPQGLSRYSAVKNVTLRFISESAKLFPHIFTFFRNIMLAQPLISIRLTNGRWTSVCRSYQWVLLSQIVFRGVCFRHTMPSRRSGKARRRRCHLIPRRDCKRRRAQWHSSNEQVKKLFDEASSQVSRYAGSDIVRDSVKTTTLHKLVVIYRGIDMVTCEEIQ